MAKKVKRNGKKGMTLPVAALAGFIPLVGTIKEYSAGGINGIGIGTTLALTGYDMQTRKWWFPNLYRGTIPIVIGLLAHKIIGGKLGVNRMLAAAKIPFVRI